MNKLYDVTIVASVRKTYRIGADSEDEAIELAHNIFSVLNDDTDEDYDQETIACEEVDPDDDEIADMLNDQP